MAQPRSHRTCLAVIGAWALLVTGTAIATPALAQQQEPAAPPVQREPLRPVLERFDIERFRQLDVIRRGAGLEAQDIPAEPPARERDPRLADIDWAAARQDHERQLADFRQRTQTTVTRVVTTESYTPFIAPHLIDRLEPVHMPVLLPQVNGAVAIRPGGEPGLMLRTRANFYDASFYQNGLSVAISGTRLINHRINAPELRRRLDIGRGADGVQVQADESGGYTANFSRYGAAYTVTIECGTARDPRCQSEDTIRAIVGRLVIAGGNPEE
ncbi:MAG: hypothetical protein GC187_13530 [Alphaproteobacteria bacterium]|nr:hypothetical protein [Alphaproteobacteria bacterium]